VKNPYKVLGVAVNATPDHIRTAYRQLVKELHPDKHSYSLYRIQKEERLKEVNAAYDLLKKGFSVSGVNTDWTAEDAAQRKSAGTATHRDREEDSEASAARFWDAFHKAEQKLKRRT
jgi:DnaJ-class molecular chaperone